MERKHASDILVISREAIADQKERFLEVMERRKEVVRKCTEEWRTMER